MPGRACYVCGLNGRRPRPSTHFVLMDERPLSVDVSVNNTDQVVLLSVCRRCRRTVIPKLRGLKATPLENGEEVDVAVNHNNLRLEPLENIESWDGWGERFSTDAPIEDVDLEVEG